MTALQFRQSCKSGADLLNGLSWVLSGARRWSWPLWCIWLAPGAPHTRSDQMRSHPPGHWPRPRWWGHPQSHPDTRPDLRSAAQCTSESVKSGIILMKKKSFKTWRYLPGRLWSLSPSCQRPGTTACSRCYWWLAALRTSGPIMNYSCKLQSNLH